MPRVLFGQIERRTLAAEIRQLIEEKILSGELSPGDQIVEIAVAAQMQVGQNTVREALQALEHQSLVTKIPHVGTFVTKLSEKEVSEIYRVRVELEAIAAELATKNLQGSTLARLEAACQKMAVAAKARDWRNFVRADFEFHETIWEAAGNRFLTKALLSVTKPLFGYLLIAHSPSGPANIEEIASCHYEVFVKMKQQEPGVVYDATKGRLQQLWSFTLDELTRSQTGRSPNTSETKKASV
ncbi:MAG: GntR family transcriptional regulator [Acidobacteria bacterium]|nr:GntR family transcriptional regulator [Acidobacteriota bacterium]